MKKIIIINGIGGSGKDTFINYVSQFKKVKNYSTITKVKQIAKEIGWNGEKKQRDRLFLYNLKKLITEYNDYFYNETQEEITKFLKSDEEIMFIHIKEIANIEKLLKNTSVKIKTLLIKRKNYFPQAFHQVEKEVSHYNYDYVIYNESFQQLANEAQNFIRKLDDEQ